VKISLAALTFLATLAVPVAASAGTGTPAGTAIVNQATSTYQDTANNSYTSTSNKVTTTVQSAPSVSVASGTLQSTVPGGQLTDTFSLTNTGNGNATFTIAPTGESGTDGSSATVAAYVLTFPSAVTGGAVANCTILSSTSESCSTITAANALLANQTEASSAVVTVGVVYNVAAGAAAGTIALPNTVVTNMTVTTTQTVAGNPGTTAPATSTAIAANTTDNVVTDGRIDSTVIGVEPNSTTLGVTNATSNIEYVVSTANGGSVPDRDLQSVKTLLGSSAAGVFFSDKLPAFGGNTAVVQSAAVTTSAANGYNGTSTTIYYSTSATGAAGSWLPYTGTGSLPTTATFIGVLVSGAPTSEYQTNGNSTTPGVVANAKSAVTLTFYVSPPSGTGSGNLNAYVDQVDAVNGGDQPNLNPDSAVTNPPENVVGPGVPTGTADSTTAIDSGTQGILYPTPATASASTAINASNAVSNTAVTIGSVLNGPFGVPGAIGSYNGLAVTSNNNDNSAVSFTPNGFSPVNTAAPGAAPVGNALGATATVNVANTIQNIGNATDSIAVTITAPTGFGVQIYASTAAGVQTGPVLAGSTTSNTATYTFLNVPSGGTGDTTNQVNYVAVYTVPATATAFNPYDVVLVASSVATPTSTNTTHNDLIPGGPIALSKSVTLDPVTCTGGAAVPGCIVTYAITYLNNAASAVACPATAPTAASVPSYLSGYYTKNLVISENGATAPNTWGATYTNAAGTFKNTTGLNAPAVDTNLASTFTTNTAGSYAFTDLVGGSTSYVIAPGCSGTVTFRVTVNTQ
jgi:hypothetical protein